MGVDWASGRCRLDRVYGQPEHHTKLDQYGKGRQHADLFACVRREGETVLVAGIEAKACEGFDGVVADRAASTPPSNELEWWEGGTRAALERVGGMPGAPTPGPSS